MAPKITKGQWYLVWKFIPNPRYPLLPNSIDPVQIVDCSVSNGVEFYRGLLPLNEALVDFQRSIVSGPYQSEEQAFTARKELEKDDTKVQSSPYNYLRGLGKDTLKRLITVKSL